MRASWPASSSTNPSCSSVRSRWNTHEFYFYVLVLLCGISFMLVKGYCMSRDFSPSSSSPRKSIRIPGLKPGWIGDLQMDLSDRQWREFRSHLPTLLAMVAVHLGASKLAKAWMPACAQWGVRSALALGFVCYAHGLAAVFVLALAVLNFLISNSTAGTVMGPTLTWVYCCGSLAVARLLDGFRFEAISSSLAPMDAHRGVIHWEVCYNMVVLRMISYSMDRHWKCVGKGLARSADGRAAAERLTYKSRTQEMQPDEAFHLLAYLNYLFYPPLYVAGPTVSFNAFASQMHTPQASVGAAELAG
mmetsp:Transcript_7346/g.13816  ORF Transcript_7346/g.13816 Transcript_7346/m.13816 type:complete len:303 (-) Transcript_7346:6-914(-)